MWIWRKKIERPKKRPLNTLETEIINFLIKRLPQKQSNMVKEQVKYLVLNKRFKYKSEIVVELYPERFDKIPKHCLFNRTEEFQLAKIDFKLNNTNYHCEMNSVLGAVFDIIIKPIPPKSSLLSPVFGKFLIQENLQNNVYDS